MQAQNHKTLIVHYLPTGANSNTKKLLDIFISEVKNKKVTEIENLDLLKTSVPIFNEESISAYYKRNYQGLKLNEAETKLLSQNDNLIKQFKSASVIVLACPMHNFGYPALMKAYIDAVVFHNETFAYNQKMMQGKRILTIYSSGGVYSNEKFNFEHQNSNSISLLANATFKFMGFDEVKTIGTSLRDSESYKNNLPKISSEIKEIADNWFN